MMSFLILTGVVVLFFSLRSLRQSVQLLEDQVARLDETVRARLRPPVAEGRDAGRAGVAAEPVAAAAAAAAAVPVAPVPEAAPPPVVETVEPVAPMPPMPAPPATPVRPPAWLGEGQPPATPVPSTHAAASVVAGPLNETTAGREAEGVEGVVAPLPLSGVPRRVAEPATGGAPPVEPAFAASGEILTPEWLLAIKRWFTEGNLPIKIGMIVLFVGVGAFLRYASTQGWVHFPIEFRLAAVGVAATAGVLFGWRERLRRRAFGLALQGGSVGILMLTVFAAYRLYSLLPATAAFVLLAVLVAATGILAVRQDSPALAVLGLLAGFAAPILVSRGQGDHVVLFGYYAVLNLGVLLVAWLRSWRFLTLLGYVFTFGIGTLWGYLQYRPEHFASTEPFLLFFFLLYTLIPVIRVLRRGEGEIEGPVDGGLVFGTPLIFFGLQSALLRGDRPGIALTAVGLGVYYSCLALLARRRTLSTIWIRTFAVLAITAVSIAVPIAFSAETTALTWTAEGAALYWLGVRQRRPWPRWGGIGLQALAAMASILVPAGQEATRPLLHGLFLVPFTIGMAGLVCARVAKRSAEEALWLPFFAWWGMLWAVGAGAYEIHRWVPREHLASSYLLYGSLVLAVLAAIEWAAAWGVYRRAIIALAAAAVLLVPVASLAATASSSASAQDGGPLEGRWLVAWLAYFAAVRFAARPLRAGLSPKAAGLPAALAVLVATALLALEARHLAGVHFALSSGWRDAFLGLPILIGLWLVAWKRDALGRIAGVPLDEHGPALVGATGAALTIGWALSLLRDGKADPLPFVPILNPLELMQVGAFLLLRRTPGIVGEVPRAAAWVAAFVALNLMLLRALHHWFALRWAPEMVLDPLAQPNLSVLWSVIGVVCWTLGSKRLDRRLWFVGAALMGTVLVKLIVVDRAYLGNLTGIAAFIIYGLLCTVIGYFAPLPPREAEASPESS